MRRFAFTPRWIAWHVLMVIAVVTCVSLGDWQWGRSQVTGSLQNLAYALQWPLFAVFFAVMWWRMMCLESRRLDELEAEAIAEGSPDAELADSQRADTQRADTQRADTGPTEPGDEDPERGDPEPRPRAPADTPVAPVSDDEDPELAAYNRMLARLAAQDRDAARR